MTTITEGYRALNAELHRTRKDYGRRGGRHAARVLKLLKRFDAAPARAFFAAWTAENRHMLQKKAVHRLYRSRFGGINQASFGRTLETDAVRGVNLLGIPCVEWNCEDSAWESFDPRKTRIVHVKSALRRAIFEPNAEDLSRPGVSRLVEMWKQLEAELMEPA